MNTDGLIKSIDALLSLDARGALVPHGIGDLARELLEKCAEALTQPAEQHQGEPVAWIVKTKDGYASGPRVVLREQYDVEGPDFWYGGKPPRDAEITRLYKAPPACPDLCDVVLQILKVAVNIPDGLYARAKHLAKKPTAVEVATWKRRAIEAESKLRAYDSNLLGDLFVDPKPSELVLTKCRLCDQLQADLTKRDEQIDALRQGMKGDYDLDAWLAFVEEAPQLRLDAGRYRWLRSRDLETISQGGVFAGMTPDNLVLNEETLDQAIDAAMAPDYVEASTHGRLNGIPKEPCSGCGTPGWTGACNKCIPY